MNARKNYFARLPQDVRRVVMMNLFRGNEDFMENGPVLNVLLHPDSPFADDVGIVTSEMRVYDDLSEDFLLKCQFFKRFGSTLDKLFIVSGSPHIYTQVRRYCPGLKRLLLRLSADLQGIWQDTVNRLSLSLEQLSLFEIPGNVDLSGINTEFPKLEYFEFQGEADFYLSQAPIQLLDIFGSNLRDLDLDLEEIEEYSADMAQALGKTLCANCPKLQQFDNLRGLPPDVYSSILKHFGSQVRTADLMYFSVEIVGDATLCHEVLEACPNLRASIFEIGNGDTASLDDLNHVASRLNGDLMLQNYWDVEASEVDILKEGFNQLLSLTSVVCYVATEHLLSLNVLLGTAMPSLRSLTINALDLKLDSEIADKIIRIVPQLWTLSISCGEHANEDLWIQAFTVGTNLEELVFRPWCNDNSSVISSVKGIIDAVRNHPKLVRLELFRVTTTPISRKSFHAEVRDAVQEFRHKQILVGFEGITLIDNRTKSIP